MSDNPDFYGKEECWKPFLEAGSTWAEFTESKALSSAFVEDSLCNIAALIGLDNENILADYESRGDTAEGNTIELFYKNKATKQVSIETKMKNAFAEALEPHGFKKVKGKYPYFAKLIGNEILEVITFRGETRPECVGKNFDVFCGVATIYNSEIDLRKSPWKNRGWINNNYLNMFDRMYINCEIKPQRPIYPIVISNSNDATKKEIERAIEITEKYIVPPLATITDIKSCLNYFRRYSFPMMYKFPTDGVYPLEKEYLYIAMCKNIEGYTAYRHELFETNCEEILQKIQMGKIHYTIQEFEEKKEKLRKSMTDKIEQLNNTIFNPALQKTFLIELERRKKDNTKNLIQLGIINDG